MDNPGIGHGILAAIQRGTALLALPVLPRPARRSPEGRSLGLAAAVAMLVILAPPRARAHGDAEWIERDVEWRWCCGPEDCRRAQPGEVERTDKGFLIPRTNQIFHEGLRGYYQHMHDHEFWLCIRGGAVICLFVPEGMS